MGMTNVDRERVPSKTTVLFFIVDTSGSMSGTRIGAVNSAIEQTLEKLREMNADNADSKIDVALLEFSSGAKWLTPNGPVSVDNYYWNDLDADGLTYMGEAFRLLEEKLHKSSGFMSRASGSYAPVLFLMSDGEPNDDYKTPLAKLQNNQWFKVSTKVALGIGDEANDQVLIEFTGSKEAVVRIRDGANAGEKLAKMVQFIAITSSQVASQPADSSGKTKQDLLEGLIAPAVNDIDDWDVGDSTDSNGDVWDSF
jgi:uncharacterized protein YegL